MKYFLKPLGHCLTTAVMTSAMLRCYAPPAIEAATPDADRPHPAPAQAPDSTPDSASPLTAIPLQAVSAPESLPAESSAILAPEAAKPDASPAPIPQTGSAVQTDATVQSGSGQSAAESKPAESIDSGRNPSAGAAGDTGKTEVVPAGGSANNADASPSTAQTAAPARTVAQVAQMAQMRQVVAQRLAAIVGQDKLRRETQWQQALIYTTLQYAWTGRFDEARQVAQHPALSADIQTELLAKITMIQLERQPGQVAGKPVSNPQTAVGTPGRNLPSSNVAGLPGGAYSSVSLAQQCPVVPANPLGQKSRPLVPAQVPAQPSIRPDKPVQALSPDGVPAFVPALSQSLAGRLVRLSQLPPALPPAQARRASIQPPEMFVGVARRLQPATSVKLAISTPKRLSAMPSSADLRPVSLPVGLPAPATVQTTPPTALPPIASFGSSPLDVKPAVALNPKLNPHQPAAYLPAQAERQTGQTVMMPTFWNLDQMLGNAFDQSLGQLGLSLPDWIAAPLDSDWRLWAAPSPVQPAAQSGSSTAQLQSRSFSFTAAQSLEQPLTRLSGRDMRKLSLPALSKPVKATTIPASVAANPSAKPVLYDAAALLAISCAQDPLTHYSGDSVIDPASAKQLGWVNLMFPLPIAAVLTSAFGWRVHPISGALSFHAGIDLGAPMGTPVLAATSGQVVMADQMGGYGLAVVVEAGNQRNLYGHLSGIAVQPGEKVAQGAILGWVGSTGNSTGPHLHFESQVETSSGWTAVNPIASATLTAANP